MRTGLISSLFGSAAAPRRTDGVARILAGGGDTAPAGLGNDSLALSGAPKNARFADAPDLRAAMAGQPLRMGAKGESIKAVQTALLDLGFGLPAGADGAFGGQTSIALKNFQASQGLPKTGDLDAATMRRLDEVAPAPGLKAWEDPNISPKALVPPTMVRGKLTRGIAAIDQHRFFLYDRQGKLEKIYPIASGKGENATDLGIKVVSGKLADPSHVARELWPESGGRAFGTRLVDLSWLDPKTGKIARSGEELHGTFDRNSIGKDASHGCMRFFNEDIEEVYERLNVGDVVITQA
jgi:lipoprotein-anchoring transpeptidase ErfK/SrfK